MAFMPIPTMIISVVAGIMALAYIPGLEGASTDQVFGRVLREIQLHSVLGYALVVVMLAAILAAMMEEDSAEPAVDALVKLIDDARRGMS